MLTVLIKLDSEMTNVKTFSLNVFFAVVWVLLCVLSFATDIDYVENTMTQKVLSALMQLFILTIPIITAIYLYKSNNCMLRKVVLFSNYSALMIIVLCLLAVIYNQPSLFSSFDFVILFFIYFVFSLPFLINLKVLKAS